MAASSASVVGGVVLSVSAGGTAGTSGGGVGKFLVDMVRVKEDMNPSFAAEARVTD